MVKHTVSDNNLALIGAAVGILINIGLAVMKLSIGMVTNNVCIFSDSVNNFLDSLSCIIAVTALFFLTKIKSDRYPFGYGRFEYLGTFIVSVIVIIVGVQFAMSAIERLVYPSPVLFMWKYFIMMCVSIAVKIGLGVFFLFIYKKTLSPVIKALMLDSFMDAGITTMSVISFTLIKKLGTAVDGYFGLAICVIIVIEGIKLLRENGAAIVGKKPMIDEAAITDAVLKSGAIKACANLKVHNYGNGKNIATLEVEFEDGVSLDKAISAQEELKKQISDTQKVEIDFVVRRDVC